jgi:hypothetical protein
MIEYENMSTHYWSDLVCILKTCGLDFNKARVSYGKNCIEQRESETRIKADIIGGAEMLDFLGILIKNRKGEIEQTIISNYPNIIYKGYTDNDVHPDGWVIAVDFNLTIVFHDLYYIEYINSNEWKSKRQKLFEKRGRFCEKCASMKRLQLHHLTYKRLGNELETDLMILCNSCHKKEHNL